MIDVIIVSGFLGSGKTTLIKKLLNNKDSLKRVMLLENEFGEVGIDGQVLKNDIQVKEINSGCICCSLNGKLEDALEEISHFDIDTLIIEPSGVAKLSEIKRVFEDHTTFRLLNSVTMVDVTKALRYHKNFKEFYEDQIKHTDVIVLSRTDVSEYKLVKEIMLLCEKINSFAIIVTTPIQDLSDTFIFEIIEDVQDKKHCCDCECCCGESDDPDCECHHHHHDEECGCHEHRHHHDCDCHDHEHHHDCDCGHHHADYTFNSVGFQTPKKYNKEELLTILENLPKHILRAKGIVELDDHTWIHFEYTPGEVNSEIVEAYFSGLVSVIGVSVKEEEIKEIFKINE